jgi:predicted nuclease of predicted toxin-antitoxin system
VLLGFQSATDTVVWDYAKSKGLTIVTKDRDFVARANVLGPPPQVIWLKIGNCTVSGVASVLRRNASAIDGLCCDPTMAILILDQ